MEGERVYGGPNIAVMLPNDNSLPCSSELLQSQWNSITPPFHEEEENRINDCDGCFYQPEKKRRLSTHQVHQLERNFEVENKLEPERKVQLAKELGLQPRQVAIWFQNRRARFKTKQLEKDYGSLRASYDSLNNGYDALLKERERLKNEVHLLKQKLILMENESTNSKSDQQIDTSIAEFQKQVLKFDSETKSRDPMVTCKQEDTSSTNSDVFDTEPSDCEDELFIKTILPTEVFFPSLEDAHFDDPTEEGYNCNWSFSTEGQPSWSWPY